MEYLSGKELSNQIKEKVKEEVTLLNRKPHMVVLVNPNDESTNYLIGKKCISLRLKNLMKTRMSMRLW